MIVVGHLLPAVLASSLIYSATHINTRGTKMKEIFHNKQKMVTNGATIMTLILRILKYAMSSLHLLQSFLSNVRNHVLDYILSAYVGHTRAVKKGGKHENRFSRRVDWFLVKLLVSSVSMSVSVVLACPGVS